MAEHKHPVRVLHIFFDHYRHGGIERLLEDLIPSLNAQPELELSFLCTSNSQMFDGMASRGVETHGFYSPWKHKSLIKSFFMKPLPGVFDVITAWKLNRFLKKHQPDIVHIHNGRVEQNWIKRFGFRLVYTYHGYGHLFNLEAAPSPIHRAYYTLMRPLFQWLIPSLDGMTIVSKAEKERIQAEAFIPADYEPRLIHNGIPVRHLQESVERLSREAIRQKLNVPEGRKVIGFFCRLAPDKNALALLDVAKEILKREDLPNKPYWLIGGEGRFKEDIEAAFGPGGPLEGQGAVLGFRDDVPQLIHASDLTVSFSLQEGFGLRVLESIMLGRPSVVYAAGGIGEILEGLPEADTWQVEVGNEAAFVDELVSQLLISDEVYQSQELALKQHALNFDLHTCTRKLVDFYQDVMNGSLNKGGYRDTP